MRAALRQNPGRVQVAQAVSVPAPTGGWDTESPLAAMPPQNAVILDNWIPRAAYCEIRRGYMEQVTGVADPVESLMAWRGDAAGDKLFAASGSSIYDVTTAGALGSAEFSSASSARWKYTNFSNDGGVWIITVNGIDTPMKYDGLAFSTTAITGSSGAVTLDPKTLADVMVHQRRLFFIEGGSLRVWFLDVNAIAGAAGLLDLGGYFYKGGQLAAQATWSLDGGQGTDDMAVFVTTEGQVAVFQGIDPADANNWSLVGIFDLARVIGSKCLTKYGADLVVLTQDGVVPLSQALSRDRSQDDATALTAKIGTAFSEASRLYGQNFGWQAMLYPGHGALAIVNVPTVELGTSVQFVQTILTGAWCRFTGLNAFCWEYANDKVYFGGALGVYQWNVGASDNGEVIVADAKPAFSAFGSVRKKLFTMVRALLKAPFIIQPALEINVDYKESIPTAVQTVVNPGDLSPDDATTTRYDWTKAAGAGYVATPRMRVSIVGSPDVAGVAIDEGDVDRLVATSGGSDHILTGDDLPLDVPVQLIGFDLMYQPGGQL